MREEIQKVLVSEEEIVAAIEGIAERITAEFSGKPFTVVSILKGSCIFASDLIRRLPIPLELAFVSASSYQDSTSPGELRFRFLPEEGEIRGRSLLLVDDILDTGRTMSALQAEFLGRGATDVATCVFLDKPARRRVDISPDYRCFEIEDRFVVGYGLDYAGRYRNLPFVAALKPEVIAHGAAGG